MNARADEAFAAGLTPAQAYEQADTLFRSNTPRSPDQALASRERLLSLARRSGNATLIADALLWHHQTLLFSGRHAQAQSAREQSRSIALRLDDAARLAACDIWEAQVLRRRGLYVDSVIKITQALPRLVGHRDPARMRQRALVILSDIYRSLSLWERAIDTSTESVQLATSRGDEAAVLRSIHDELYTRFKRAEARYSGLSAMPPDDDDLLRVETIARSYLEACDPASCFAVASNFAFLYKRLLFIVLASTGRLQQATTMWAQQGHIIDRYDEPLGAAEVAFHHEGPQRAVQILGAAVEDPDALTAEDLASAWRLLSTAHQRLGDQRAALHALRVHIKLELGLSHTSAKVQAALLALELEAEREKLLAQRALIHAGKLAAVGQLASSIAHEVSQPSAALMLLEADARQALRDQRWPLLDEVLGDMQRQDAAAGPVVNRMKEFSRDDPLHMQRLNLREVVDEAHGLCKPAIGAAQIDYEQNVADVQVHADKERVILTLVNLVNNALDAMRGQSQPQPRLRIEAVVQDDGRQVRLGVIDNGPGLSEPAQVQVLQPFFTTKSTGLGLGLTITREALAGMGARLEVGNAPGGGACFSLLLQIAVSA